MEGEVTFAVPPLPESNAFDLFVERARQARHGFEVDETNAASVTRICQQLDGIPLAIELAAAWCALMTPAEVASKLADPLAVLVGGDRQSLPRHRAMQAALDWSVGLLSSAERALLARLAVFPMTFDLAAVEAVSAESGLGSGDVLRLLSRLANRSLVLVAQGPTARYRLLRVVRQYVASELGSDETAARLHASWFLSLSERIGAGVDGVQQAELLRLLDEERPNLRAALAWYQDHAQAEGALRIAVGCWWACYLLGRFGEGREWLETALAVAGEAPASLRAEAMVGAVTMAYLQGDEPASDEWLRSALAEYRSIGDPAGVGVELNWLGGVAMRRGDYAEARRLGERSVALWDSLGDETRAARALDSLSMRELLAGSLDRAGVLAEDAVVRHERAGNVEALAWTTTVRGGIALYRGDLVAARELLVQALRAARAGSFRNSIAWALSLRGVLAQRDGESLGRAWAELLEALRLLLEAGNSWRAASVLETAAGVAVASSDAKLAAQLLGHASRLRQESGYAIPAVERADVERVTASARHALGPSGFAEQWELGELSSLDELVESLPVELARPSPVVAEPSTPLQLLGFGASAARRDGVLLGPADWGYAKPRELLFFLLGEESAHKDAIGAALWPEASTLTLRNSFHTCLHQLRRALRRPEWIVFQKGRYAFNRSLSYSYDVERFAGLVGGARSASELSEAVDLYRGEYCADLSGPWVDARRTALRQSYERALLDLASLRTSEGAYGAAAELYLRAIEHDPLLEPAHRELMACYVRMGDRGRALRHYQILVALLADELGVGPSAETVALHAALVREPGS
jgi:predicted ATPase/DNA-binding SARP family transcriptional activator